MKSTDEPSNIFQCLIVVISQFGRNGTGNITENLSAAFFSAEVSRRSVEPGKFEMSQERPNKFGIRRGRAANGFPNTQYALRRAATDQDGFILAHR